MATLQEALGYELRTPNAFQRLVQNAGSSPPGAWVLSKVLEPADKLVARVTKGRATAAGVLASLPVVTLTTTGARSGERRTSPLLGIPLEGTLAVMGTNYGQPATPAWVYNLEANPTAEVTYNGATSPVVARPADDADFDRAFERAALVYPGYQKYQQRITNRRIRVFILAVAP